MVPKVVFRTMKKFDEAVYKVVKLSYYSISVTESSPNWYGTTLVFYKYFHSI